MNAILEAAVYTMAAGAVLAVLALWAGMWRAVAETQARRQAGNHKKGRAHS